jgi:hypothetical protein
MVMIIVERNIGNISIDVLTIIFFNLYIRRGITFY